MKANKLIQQIQQYLDFVHPEGKGNMVEVCIIGRDQSEGKRFSGYIKNSPKHIKKIVKQIIAMGNQSQGTYITLNPCNEDALENRSHGKIEICKERTRDNEISIIENILIDVDPVRPSGVSATDEEHEKAIKLARKIAGDLKKAGWSKPLIVDSGNGAHLIFKVNMKNDEHNVNLIKRDLHALALRYDTDEVKIDKNVFNPGRLVKLPGTFTRKGENLPDRPHRRATILKMPKLAKKVSIKHLETLAASVSESSKDAKAPTSKSSSLMDVEAYLKHYGVKTREIKPFRGGTLHVLKTCLFNESHASNKASIMQSSEGTLYYQCFHNSCRDKKWSDARWEISGNDKLDQFFKNLPMTETKDEIRYSFMTVDELIQQRIKERPLIKGLLEKGGSLLILGQTDSMKSMMTLNIALNLANPPADKRLWGIFDIPKPINTLFIQSENGIFYTQNRIQLMVKGDKRFEAALPRLSFPNIRKDCRLTGDLNDEKFQEMLKDMIYKTKSRLVVIDPLISFHSKNENDNVEIRKVLDILTGICDVTKTACLVIHHLGKTNSGNVFSGRGASALADWASNILLIDKEDKGGKDDGVLLNVKYLKSRNFLKCPPFALEVSGELQFTKVESAEEENNNLVVEVLESLGGSVDDQKSFKQALVDHGSGSSSSAGRQIEKALNDGVIEMVPNKQKKGYRLINIEEE